MSKKLIITEKPSVARSFAQALHVSGNHNGYIENNEWIITWAVGHLVTMSYPQVYDEKYAKWNLEDLPFLPDKYLYEVIKDVKEQFGIVKNLLKNSEVSCIYNAGDSGREGEYIQRLIFTQAGVEGKKEIRRVWIDSQTDEEILRGIREAKPEKDYDNLKDAAYMRAIEDYSIGINLSRALSCKFGYEFNKKIENELKVNKDGKKPYMPLAVGRVMTCVLGMIADREREIQNFKVTNYYKIEAAADGFSTKWKWIEGKSKVLENRLYDATGFKTEAFAREFTDKLSADKRLRVEDVKRTTSKKGAPFLYNLAELQSDCTKRLKLSPDETHTIAQKLYEAKMTTYPRTDARVLSTAISKEIGKNISGIANNYSSAVQSYAKEIADSGRYNGIEKSHYCDDSKITDHYAIIPTGYVNAEILNADNTIATVYDMIVRRFLSIFMPPAEYAQIEAEFMHTSGERFFFSSKVLQKKGYLEVSQMGRSMDTDADKEVTFPPINKGDIITIDSFDIKEASTQPPKRYTSGSMILAMENAGKLIEDEELREQIKGSGIGTSATRAEVISKLVRNRYIDLNKKTQILTPTNIGFAVVDIVKGNIPSLLSPEMTASWEKGLAGIESGNITKEQYQSKLYKFVTDNVESIKAKTAEQGQYKAKEKRNAGKCPHCGKDVWEVENSYFLCSGWKKNDAKACQFGFRKNTNGHQLSEEEICLLLAGKKIEPVKMRKKDNSGEYLAGLEMDEKTGKVAMYFPHNESSIVCPKCGKNLEESEKAWACKDCGITIWKTLSGKALTEDIVFQVLGNGITDDVVNGFVDKANRGYSGWIIMRDGKFIIVKTVMNSLELTKDIAIQLRDHGCTDKLDGFVSLKGSEFSAALKIDGNYVAFDFGNDNDSGKPKKSSGKKTSTRKRTKK